MVNGRSAAVLDDEEKEQIKVQELAVFEVVLEKKLRVRLWLAGNQCDLLYYQPRPHSIILLLYFGRITLSRMCG